MRITLRARGLLALAGLVGASAMAIAQTANGPASARRVIGTHQIDRYGAIEQVRQELTKNPKNLSDWVLLGELAQEVATDAPPDRAPGYYRLARESFDNALKLDPNNASLKAAADFARQQEQGSEKFAESRRQATSGYLAARRQELAQSNNAPALRVYQPAAQATAPAAAATPYTAYQPYVGAQGQPYTYQQHYDSFFGPVQARTPDQVITATERAALVKPAARFAPP
jgi:hypothetical protein